MKPLRSLVIVLVLGFLCPTSSSAFEVYVSPPAPSEVDNVSIVGILCGSSNYALFNCQLIDAHTFRVDLDNYWKTCFPDPNGGQCFFFPADCSTQFEGGRFEAGVLAPGHYVVQIYATLDEFGPVYSEISFDVQSVASGVQSTPAIPQVAVMPNPFTSSANIEIALSKRAHAALEVFDVRGHRVRTLVDQSIDAPAYRTQWDGRDATGQRLASGVYFARLSLDGVSVATKRIVLLR